MKRFFRKWGLWLAALAILLAAVATVLFWPRGSAAPAADAETRETAAVSLPVTVAAPDPRLADAHAANADSVAWLTIPGTNIDAPVQQADDNDYYLRRNAAGEYDEHGSLYADYDCDLSGAATLPRNLVIYGHTFDEELEDSFGQLHNYRVYEFGQEHPYIYLSLSDAMLTYQIFSAGVARADTDYDCISTHPDDNEFRAILAKAFDRCPFDYGVAADAGDQILTLSTCTDDPNVRYLVTAKLVDYVEVK